MTVIVAWLLVIVIIIYITTHIDAFPRSIDKWDLDRSFHGLILFGMDGAFVYVRDIRNTHEVCFGKRIDVHGKWCLDVQLRSTLEPESLWSNLSSQMSILSPALEVEKRLSPDEKYQIRWIMVGEGLQDPDSLEGLARLILRTITPPGGRYRTGFEGPKDTKAIDEFFGFGKKTK